MAIDMSLLSGFITETTKNYDEVQRLLPEVLLRERIEIDSLCHEINKNFKQLRTAMCEYSGILRLHSTCNKIGLEAAQPIVESLYDKELFVAISSQESLGGVLDKLVDFIVYIIKGILNLFKRVFIKLFTGATAAARKQSKDLIRKAASNMDIEEWLVDVMVESEFYLEFKDAKMIADSMTDWGSKFMMNSPRLLADRLVSRDSRDEMSDIFPPTNTSVWWYSSNPPLITLQADNWPEASKVRNLGGGWNMETIRSLSSQINHFEMMAEKYPKWLEQIQSLVEGDLRKTFFNSALWINLPDNAKAAHEDNVQMFKNAIAYFSSWGEGSVVFISRYIRFEIGMRTNLMNAIMKQ